MLGDRGPLKLLKNKDLAVKDAKDWVVRGRERPRPAGLPRRLTPRWSLPPTYYQRPKPVPGRY
jgi:hypothetical protein